MSSFSIILQFKGVCASNKYEDKTEINLVMFKNSMGYSGGQSVHSMIFERLDQIQEALVTPPFTRSKVEVENIVSRLLLIPFLAGMSDKAMRSLAQCVEYRPLTVKRQLFNQDKDPDSVCIIMKGHVQAKLDLPPTMASLSPVVDYFDDGVIGHMDLLLHKDCPLKVENFINLGDAVVHHEDGSSTEGLIFYIHMPSNV